MAVSKPLLTEFGIDHRLESCDDHSVWWQVKLLTTFQLPKWPRTKFKLPCWAYTCCAIIVLGGVEEPARRCLGSDGPPGTWCRFGKPLVATDGAEELRADDFGRGKAEGRPKAACTDMVALWRAGSGGSEVGPTSNQVKFLEWIIGKKKGMKIVGNRSRAWIINGLYFCCVCGWSRGLPFT